MKKVKKKIFTGVLILVASYLLLLVPLEKKDKPDLGDKKQFVWNRDSLWLSLESVFARNRAANPSLLKNKILSSIDELKKDLEFIENKKFLPSDSIFPKLEHEIFQTAALVGSSPVHLAEFIDLFSRIRNAVKKQSVEWNMNDITARQTIYKLVYGGRAAVEELLLQTDARKISPLIQGKEEPSYSPEINLKGAVVRSGDILVSRGGAPTSALIARGNDYPGNFSHVALLYVDEKNNHPYIIESHIEKGVTVSSVDEYLNDKKLRIMVLRLRADLNCMINDRMIPHKAAKYSFDRASGAHIPYDFTMNIHDTSKLFCSEVASSAYKKFGVNLWMGLSHISSPGVARWLSGFGVKYFTTQEPSDLEYDPQLSVAAEWRDAATLFKDHMDNAVIEAMLEKAEEGKGLEYDWYLLPPARILKFYSSVINLFGKIGPVPEGMSPESALRSKKLTALHDEVISVMDLKVKEFENNKGYKPPYWQLVNLARNIINERNLL